MWCGDGDAGGGIEAWIPPSPFPDKKGGSKCHEARGYGSLLLLLLLLQVDVAVVTRTVVVRHAPSLTCPATLVAALNAAKLGASLTFPRQHTQVGVIRWCPHTPHLKLPCRSWIEVPGLAALEGARDGG
jgi:hypothetical protein